MPDATVSQLLFFALHDDISAVDARLLRHYERELRPLSQTARAWVLLHSPSEPDAARVANWRTLGTPVFPWRREDVFSLYPRLAEAFRTSDAVRDWQRRGEPQYMTDHFYFHASLAVWFAAHGHAFPAVSHVWRFEPDALFAGGLDALMAWSRAHSADVVLPRIKTQAETPKYPPFTRDPQLLAHVPASQRVWSYFVVGRYSRRFLGLMERKWADGQIGFEEVFLPTSCANHSSAEWPCVLHGLGRGLHANGDPRADAAIVGAAHTRYRPAWDCAAFVAARERRTLDFWHPIKQRACVADYLDGNETVVEQARRWAYVPPSPPPPRPPPPSPPLPPWPPSPPPGAQRFQRAFVFQNRRHNPL